MNGENNPNSAKSFWATQAHAELDLMVFKQGKRLGFEFKYTDTPKVTPSMHIALQDLKLDKLLVITPKGRKYPLTKNITVCDLESFVKSAPSEYLAN